MKEQVEINEVMTEGVIAIEQESSIVKASRKLNEEGIRGLVVVDNGEAVGVIVCRDIVYEVVAPQKEPSETKVGDVMSTDLIVAEEDEYLDDVAMAMAKNNISRVPVVRGEMLVGILTQSDILRAWPGFAEIMGEEIERSESAVPTPEAKSGECESCENYSEDLLETDGALLCQECR